jgi:hypothetical protein
LILKAQNEKAEMEEALKRAKEEGEQEALAKVRSNRGAVVLGAGASPPPKTGNVAPELKDSKKFGGATAVLADRSRRRRQGLL